MEKSYKDKVFDVIYENRDNLAWVRDESVKYSDYECNIGDLKLRVVSCKNEKYLQVLQSLTNYSSYNVEEYPKVSEILDSCYKQWQAKVEDAFFKDVFYKLCASIDEFNKR